MTIRPLRFILSFPRLDRHRSALVRCGNRFQQQHEEHYQRREDQNCENRLSQGFNKCILCNRNQLIYHLPPWSGGRSETSETHLANSLDASSNFF